MTSDLRVLRPPVPWSEHQDGSITCGSVSNTTPAFRPLPSSGANGGETTKEQTQMALKQRPVYFYCSIQRMPVGRMVRLNSKYKYILFRQNFSQGIDTLTLWFYCAKPEASCMGSPIPTLPTPLCVFKNRKTRASLKTRTFKKAQ